MTQRKAIQPSHFHKGAEAASFLPPYSAVANPAGFLAPAIVQSHHSPAVKAKMVKVAAQLVNDPMAMTLFCDRIYQLLSEDIKTQQERSYGYGRRHS